MAESASEFASESAYRVDISQVLLSAITLVIYEYLVTFTTEVQLFWARELTGASILFFINRYLMLLYIMAELWGYSPLTATVSVAFHWMYFVNVPIYGCSELLVDPPSSTIMTARFYQPTVNNHG
ncbi:hypothetical protein V8D89_004955 [Ganoderma adspersum]